MYLLLLCYGVFEKKDYIFLLTSVNRVPLDSHSIYTRLHYRAFMFPAFIAFLTEWQQIEHSRYFKLYLVAEPAPTLKIIFSAIILSIVALACCFVKPHNSRMVEFLIEPFLFKYSNIISFARIY